MRRTGVVLVVPVVLALVAACTGSKEGAMATDTPSSAAATTTLASGAPPGSTPATPATTTATPPAPTVAVPEPATTVADAAVECQVVQVAAGAAAVEAERCEPVGPGPPRPGALVLNGCGGYVADAGITSLVAQRLAAHGVVALRLDYLGVRPAPPFTYCDPARVVEAAPDLVLAVSGALGTLRADPTVDPARVGVVGYSLGGLVASLTQAGGGGFAEVADPRLGVLGLLSAVVPGQLTELAGRGEVPPLVLVVGADDEAVGSAGTLALAEAARTGGVVVDLDVVDGQGHEWVGAPAEAAADRIARFVASHLAGDRPAASS